MELKFNDYSKQNNSEQLISPHNYPIVVEQQISKLFLIGKNIYNGKNVENDKNYDISPKKAQQDASFDKEMDIYLKIDGTFRENRNNQVKSYEMTCLSYTFPQQEYFIRKRNTAEINQYWIQQMLKKEEQDKCLDLNETETRFLLSRRDKLI